MLRPLQDIETVDTQSSTHSQTKHDMYILNETLCVGGGLGRSEDVTVAACVESNHSLKLDVRRRDGGSRPETLGSVSVGAANQRLVLRAAGCLESLTAMEVSALGRKVARFRLEDTLKYCMLLFSQARLHSLSSQIRYKLLERIKTIQQLLTEFRRQVATSGYFMCTNAVVVL